MIDFRDVAVFFFLNVFQKIQNFIRFNLTNYFSK